MKHSFLVTALCSAVCCILLATDAALAQPNSGGPTPTNVTAVPLDGGVSLLLAAGGAYGLKRLRGLRKKK